MLRTFKYHVGEIIRRSRISYLRRMGVKVGDKVFISWGAWIDTNRGSVTIGDRVTITHGAKVLSHDHAIHRMGKGAIERTCTVIGNNVVIGMNAIILSGVTVGDHSIIGAGAIVTKDVPPGSLVVGYAARVIKTLDESTGAWREMSDR